MAGKYMAGKYMAGNDMAGKFEKDPEGYYSPKELI
jgi:hypothetical protein